MKLEFHITFSLLGSNVLLSAACRNTVSLIYTRDMWDEVSVTHQPKRKKEKKIVDLFLWILCVLDNKSRDKISESNDNTHSQNLTWSHVVTSPIVIGWSRFQIFSLWAFSKNLFVIFILWFLSDFLPQNRNIFFRFLRLFTTTTNSALATDKKSLLL